MEMTAVQKYRLTQTRQMQNLKTLAGKTILPIGELLTDYTDQGGEVHQVLSIMLEDGTCYKTETRAFIESYNNYLVAFGSERVPILITSSTSKRGNPYINLEVVG